MQTRIKEKTGTVTTNNSEDSLCFLALLFSLGTLPWTPRRYLKRNENDNINTMSSRNMHAPFQFWEDDHWVHWALVNCQKSETHRQVPGYGYEVIKREKNVILIAFAKVLPLGLFLRKKRREIKSLAGSHEPRRKLNFLEAVELR